MRRRKKSSSPLLLLLVVVALGFAYVVHKGILPRPHLPGSGQPSPVAQYAPSISENTAPEAAFAIVGGLPKSNVAVDVLENTGYAVGYSEEMEDPLWSAYYCGPKKAYNVADRSKMPFESDKREPAQSRLKTGDYKRHAGDSVTYDRGHMSPNYAIGTRYGPQAQSETFLLTNITPQRSALNEETWRYLECEIADRYAPSLNGVWVVVGPVFSTHPARYNGKAAIPDAFFCIIVDRDEKTGRLRALALEMDQSVRGDHTIGEFVTTIRHIENQTGLNFFSALPKDEETALETARPDTDWGWNTPLSARP